MVPETAIKDAISAINDRDETIAALKTENEALIATAKIAAEQWEFQKSRAEASERALAERAGGVKFAGNIPGSSYASRLSPLTTEPAAPEERWEVKPVGYLFRLRYGPNRWSHQDMFSDCLPDNPDDVKDVRPLYTHPAPTHNDAEGGGQCDRCQGNGEIVTDWDLYLHGNVPGYTDDDAVTECPNCNGEGRITPSHTSGEVTEAIAALAKLRELVTEHGLAAQSKANGQSGYRKFAKIRQDMHRIIDTLEAALRGDAS